MGPRISDSMESNCGGIFVFVGDVISMARSVKLTAYRPRWAFPLGTYLPNVLERILICTFQVSLTLALLNSLPVSFLFIKLNFYHYLNKVLRFVKPK